MFAATSLRSSSIAVARAARSQAGANRAMSSATRHENDPKTLQKGKEAVQREHATKDEKASWKEEVASDAEAYVKSIREEMNTSKKSIKEMQDETGKAMKAKRNE